VNHFELVISERLVSVEGIDGDIYLPNPLVAVDELMRAAAAMRVEIKDKHGAGACVERLGVENIALANFFGKRCDMRSKTMHEELIVVAHYHPLALRFGNQIIMR
jgi:hypothetical protein